MNGNGWLDPAIIVAGAAVIVAYLGLIVAYFEFRRREKSDHTAFGEWKGAVDSDRIAFKEFIKEIRDDIKEIFKRLPAPPTISDSPLRLTEFGERLAKDLDATEWVNTVAKQFEDKADGKEDFEIQEMCFEYAEAELSDEMTRSVKRVAYEHGTPEDGVRQVLALVLRDKLLAAND